MRHPGTVWRTLFRKSPQTPARTIGNIARPTIAADNRPHSRTLRIRSPGLRFGSTTANSMAGSKSTPRGRMLNARAVPTTASNRPIRPGQVCAAGRPGTTSAGACQETLDRHRDDRRGARGHAGLTKQAGEQEAGRTQTGDQEAHRQRREPRFHALDATSGQVVAFNEAGKGSS